MVSLKLQLTNGTAQNGYHREMNFEEELAAFLPEDVSASQRTDREQAAHDLLSEHKLLVLELSRVLHNRGVPVEPVMVRADKPTSRIKHFFTGDDGNPLIKVAEGWTLEKGRFVDTNGALWEWSQKQWEPVDYSEKPWYLANEMIGAVSFGSMQLGLRRDEGGGFWGEAVWISDSSSTLKQFPLREAFVMEAARLISQHS